MGMEPWLPESAPLRTGCSHCSFRSSPRHRQGPGGLIVPLAEDGTSTEAWDATVGRNQDGYQGFSHPTGGQPTDGEPTSDLESASISVLTVKDALVTPWISLCCTSGAVVCATLAQTLRGFKTRSWTQCWREYGVMTSIYQPTYGCLRVRVCVSVYVPFCISDIVKERQNAFFQDPTVCQ